MTPLDHVALVGDRLDSLAVPWVHGGSMASSLMGEARSTNDIDIAVTLEPSAVPLFVAAMQDDYYAPLEMAVTAAETHDSFNLIHLATSFKVDVFFLGTSRLDRLQMRRRISVKPPGLSREIWVTSAPDIILRKLWWYDMGGRASDRQWSDVLNLVRVQRQTIQVDELRAVAEELGLGPLLELALDEAR